jgi:hypothetical protein
MANEEIPFRELSRSRAFVLSEQTRPFGRLTVLVGHDECRLRACRRAALRFTRRPPPIILPIP